jgi:hypothetical protein
LRIDFSTIERDLTEVGQESTHRARESLPLHQRECKSSGECDKGWPVQNANVVRRQDHWSAGRNVLNTMHRDAPGKPQPEAYQRFEKP